MASARRTGTNEDISTYGAGQEYSVLNTWESDTDNDNVAGTVSPWLECLAGTYDDLMITAGAVNNGIYFRGLRPQPGNFPTGVRDTGPCFYSTTDQNVFRLNENDFHLQDICGRVTQNSTTGRAVVAANPGTGGTAALYVVGVIATNSQNAGTGVNLGLISNSVATVSLIFVDCLSENNEGEQVRCTHSQPTLICYNVTAIGGTHGFNQTLGTVVLKNCLAHGTSTADFNGTLTCTTCASEDATADDNGGTGNRVNQAFTFANAGANNYHLAGTDAGARTFGTDLSADATFAFDDDIDRQRAPKTWSIGFDQLGWALPFHSRLRPMAALLVR